MVIDRFRGALAVLIPAICYGAYPPTVHAQWQDAVGFTELQAELGSAMPAGAGVPVSMAEARVTNPDTTIRYLPDLAGSQFAGKTILDGTGVNVGVNSHANGVANLFFGNTQSMAPGVTQITGFDADSWLAIELGSVSSTVPTPHPYKVQNHSWIANYADNDAAMDFAMRVDFLTERDDVLIIGGSTNGGTTPDLLAHSYNAISVGRTDGGHGSGPTNFYGAGRPRPSSAGHRRTVVHHQRCHADGFLRRGNALRGRRGDECGSHASHPRRADGRCDQGRVCFLESY